MDTLIQLGYDRQAEIEAAKAAFFNSGGSVRQCGLSETRPKRPSMWNSAITRRNGARREFERKEGELAKLIRDNAVMESEFGTVRLMPIEVRNKLPALGEKLSTPQVEQIAAECQIKLAEGGKLT
jgi:hypothetical protein